MRNECQFLLVRRQNSQQWDGGITQSFVQALIKENIKVLRHLPLRGEFTGG